MVYRWIDIIQSRIAGHCLLCSGHCPPGNGLDLCPDCRHDLPANQHPCPACGEPGTADGQLCGHCQRQPPASDRTIAPWLYAPPLDGLILRMKSPAGISAARTLGKLLARELDRQTLPAPQLLLPIPLHPSRLRERGFNQAALLAKQLSARLGIPWDARLLTKTRQSEDQRGLDRRSRQRNLRDSFSCAALPPGCHVALVDDVITTGATSNEAAKTLKRAGAAKVEVWALARTP